MIIFETLTLAFTNLLTNRLRSFLTILGIVIGVMSVILLTSVVSGLQKTITTQISSFGANTIYIFPGQTSSGRSPGGATVNRLTNQKVLDLKNRLKDRAEVSAVVTKSNNIKFQNQTSKNSNVTGAEANYPQVVPAIVVTKGRFFNQSEVASFKKVAVIGPTTETNLFGNRSSLGQKIRIGEQSYTVIGVLKARGSVFGLDQDNAAVIPLSVATRQFGIENVNFILISANTTQSIKSVQKQAIQILTKSIDEEDFTTQTSEQTLETITQITAVLTAALGGIAAISLIVGGIGIMNIMLVSVTERTREIGLRKALGAKASDIRNQFLIEAMALSGLGGVIGILLGIGFSLLINLFLATTITWWSITLSFGFSMLVGVIFGVAPAIRAARLNPIEALRYE